MAVKKPKRRNSWRCYEAGKKAIAARNLPPAEYEKSIRQLARKKRL